MDFGSIRQHLINYLASGLGGDSLAAEFVLLNILSHVYVLPQLV
jgi:hypothetical protein